MDKQAISHLNWSLQKTLRKLEEDIKTSSKYADAGDYASASGLARAGLEICRIELNSLLTTINKWNEE